MNVFTYGSLMYGEVWSRVVAGRYLSRPATLRDHARRRISGEVYPALVPAPGEAVRGVVHLDVSPSDLATLDRFEDEGAAYRRIAVTVELDDGSSIPAEGYLYLDRDRVEQADWDRGAFEEEGLAVFLRTYLQSRID